jgi:hypothetical protein
MMKVGSASFVAVILLGVTAWSNAKTVQPDTEISVRTAEPIDLKTADRSRSYFGFIEADVLDRSGAVLFPKGAEAQLTLRNATHGGTMEIRIPAQTVITFRLNEAVRL